MASIVLSAVGSAVLPGIGGALLGAAGGYLGGILDREVFGLGGVSGKAREGPRLESLRLQDSRYGMGIPYVYGRVRLAGNVIWSSALLETRHEDRQSQGKGGVSGAGARAQTTVTYSYSIHAAIALAAGPISSIETIWADGKIIYENGGWVPGVVSSSAFYLGTSSQGVNSFMESLSGTGNVPAYRGTAYIVLENLQLADFGNRLPNLTFEIVAKAPAVNPTFGTSLALATYAQDDASYTGNLFPSIVVQGTSARAERVLTFGFTYPYTSAKFEAVLLDVTGALPTIFSRAESAVVGFSGGPTNIALAQSPDKRYVAITAQNANSPYETYVVLYDVVTGTFGSVVPYTPFALGDVQYPGSIAWLSPIHLAVPATDATKRGIFLFVRSGSTLTSLGFQPVFDSKSDRLPWFATVFLRVAGGLMMGVVDHPTTPTNFYARFLKMNGDDLGVGAEIALPGFSYTVASGARPQWIKTGFAEWTLAVPTVSQLQLASYSVTASGFTLLRAKQNITFGAFGTASLNQIFWQGGKIGVISRALGTQYFSEITLGVSSFSLTQDSTVISGYNNTRYSVLPIAPGRLFYQALTGSEYQIGAAAIMTLTTSGDDLRSVVEHILSRAGYISSDYEMSALAGRPIDGYILSEPMTARQALEPLQVFDPFDIVESHDQLKSVRRDAVVDQTIPTTELRAVLDKKEPPPALEITRGQELDLPVSVTVDHIEPLRDYQVGSQRARRLATAGQATEKISLPIVCDAARAKQIAEQYLYAIWAERDQVRIYLSRRYLFLEPGDVIQIGARKLRLQHIQNAGGLLDIKAVTIQDPVFSSSASADAGLLPNRLGNEYDSLLFLFDLPPLRREDDQPGFYVAMTGINGWPGGELMRSADGVSYSTEAGFSNAASAGFTTTSLASAPTAYMDRVNSLDIQMVQGTLASVTTTELLNGANAALVGDEIIQFQNAVLLQPGHYRLSGLLRGRRGTEGFVGTHRAGETFVMLQAAGLQFLPTVMTDRGQTYRFRAPSRGQILSEASDYFFTYAHKTLEPFAPVHLRVSRTNGTGSNCTFSWIRRARLAGDWVDYIDVPLDDSAERYDLEIMNGSTVLRTFTDITSTTQLYSSAEQTTDWGGSVPASFTIRVYQKSTLYGRGKMATATF
jgi:Putative phage tail protein